MKKFYIVTELMRGGELLTVLQERLQYNERDVRCVFLEASNAPGRQC